MEQSAETHGISDVKEKGIILPRKFNTRLVPNIISVPGLQVTFILFKPYESAIIKHEVLFDNCARTNIISSLFGFNVKYTVSHHCLVQQIFTIHRGYIPGKEIINKFICHLEAIF
jgi:hypothetical protein